MRKKSIDNFIIPDTCKTGDRSMDVERLQKCLDHILKFKGKKKLESIEPAYYGIETAQAVYAFQELQQIPANGIFNHLTRTKLREVIECK